VRFKTGLAPDLDVAQAESVLALTEALLPSLKILLVQANNRLAVLLGQQPGTLEQVLGADAPIPAPGTAAAIGVPANLLRQRPDIRRTERQLAAQTARIGVAIADWYPSFSINGVIGISAAGATGLGNLFSLGSGFWSVGPSIYWNPFQGGRIRSNVQIQEALQKQFHLRYEKAVLSALAEVEDALAAFRYQAQRVKALESAVAASERTLKMALKLYKDGLTIFQNVLDAQRSLANQQNQLASAQGSTSAALVLLYKALGGGWAGEQPHEAQKAKAAGGQ
jgi:NodT family efflux transporter outer membrane factor (OMF) lipoprotein